LFLENNLHIADKDSIFYRRGVACAGIKMNIERGDAGE
jgi:hypothetical protein